MGTSKASNWTGTIYHEATKENSLFYGRPTVFYNSHAAGEYNYMSENYIRRLANHNRGAVNREDAYRRRKPWFERYRQDDIFPTGVIMPSSYEDSVSWPIRCIDSGLVFYNRAAACIYYGIDNSHLTKVIYGVSPSAKGLRFEVATPELNGLGLPFIMIDCFWRVDINALHHA